MANTPVVVLDDTMTSIANAIRSKTGGSATMTPGQMPAQIANIPSGGGGLGIPREVNANGVYGMPTQTLTFSLPSNATNVANYALGYAFSDCKYLTSADLSSLTTVSGASAFHTAFYGCSRLTSVNLSSLTTVSGVSAFRNAFGFSGLASVDFSSLTTVSGSSVFETAFNYCTSLTSIDFSSLATVNGAHAFDGAFNNCTSLTSLSFPALTASSFGSYTNQFNSMLTGVTGCTVHFPAAIQSTIGNWTSVQNGFGGTNTTVLFDL